MVCTLCQEAGRKKLQRLKGLSGQAGPGKCAQRFSEAASASASSARDAQDWVVPCPITVRARENQEHGYGSRALKPQLGAAQDAPGHPYGAGT